MTLVFYAGYGFIPIALLFLAGLAATILDYDTHHDSVLGTCIIAAGILTGVACAILRVRGSRKDPGDFKLISAKHTLLFIPVAFWCPMLIVIGLLKLNR